MLPMVDRGSGEERGRRSRSTTSGSTGRGCAARAHRGAGMRNSKCSPSPRRRPSPTSSASSPSIEPSPESVRQSPTSPASSPRSTTTWSKTSRGWGCGTPILLDELKYHDGGLALIARDSRRRQSPLLDGLRSRSQMDHRVRRAAAEVDRHGPIAQPLPGRAQRARSCTRCTFSPGGKGLKTTYYLRTLAATAAEKSTGEGGELNAVSASGAQLGAAAAMGTTSRNAASAQKAAEPKPKYCKIDNPSCEACE